MRKKPIFFSKAHNFRIFHVFSFILVPRMRKSVQIKDIFVFCVSDFFYGLYDFHHEDELPPTCRHYWVPPLAPFTWITPKKIV